MIRTILFLSAALFTAAAVSQAAVLQAGTCTLEWTIPGPEEHTPAFNSRMTRLEMADADFLAKTRGLASERAFVGWSENDLVVLDESKGTGSGYDTAILLHGALEASEIDLGPAIRMPLAFDHGVLRTDPDSQVLVDVTFGEGDSKVTRQAAVSVEVYWTEYEGDLATGAVALVNRRGSWTGKVPADTGEIEVTALDVNDNGRFSDRVSAPRGIDTSAYPDAGDALVFDTSDAESSWSLNTVSLGEASMYDGRLYVFDLSETGETLRIAPYESETGTLQFEAKDGFGSPAVCSMVTIYGSSGLYSTTKSEALLPPGDYASLYAEISPAEGAASDADGDLKFTVRPSSVVTVGADSTAVLKLGGPISMVIEPGSDMVTVKRGDSKYVQISFTVGGDPLTGVNSDRKAWVNIRDSKGKLLSSEQSGFG